MRVWRREPGSGAEAGDPFLLILSPGIPGFGTGRLSLAGGGAQAGCMSWATSQEYTMFPSALAAALSGWPPPKPLPLQPPCPTFPGCLAPPSSSALTSPLPPAPSPPLTAAGPGYCGDCEAGQPGALRAGGGRRSTRPLCLCKIQTWGWGGVGEHGLPLSAEIAPRSQRTGDGRKALLPEESGLKIETGDRATDYKLGGHFQRDETENPDSSILCFLCFLALVFFFFFSFSWVIL